MTAETPDQGARRPDDPDGLSALARAYLDMWERLASRRAALGPEAAPTASRVENRTEGT